MAVIAEQAFEDFYARYFRRLRGFVVRAYGPADADDLAQDAMVRAYASFGRLDPARDPWPWLLAIARNVARDRHARSRPVPLADLAPVVADATAAADERAVVRAALRRLPAGDRNVLLLREWHELTFAELAALLGGSPNALRQQVFRARRRLAEAYTALGGRALGLAAWLRWRAGDAAVAGAVAGALVAGGAPAPEEPGPAPPPGPARMVAAGPAVHGGTPAGPTARGTAPVRPLLPSRAAPPPRPAPRVSRPSLATPRPPGAEAMPAPPRPSVSAADERAGHRTAGRPVGGDAVVCAVTALCDRDR